ncbi:ABC transporter ATP-binding protein [Virgisporangium aurantiacum]|uniref:Multidrug ABC transporter ATP-binding protein n=1 Tax=Virgisporangium aurantiacum TaxID=175570 RepID=A0A8J3YZT7_9ACTN|nr:ABC transporter ATP-binding protein [Virgisporangium aurantiacum]GIJ53617.1 multidrug ABC transporter ATP-binding protein [Virgisporangium aurantiacum]
MTTDPVLRCAGLRCRYGDYEAVRGVDLTVGRGELFALLGTNGAGKTTILDTLQGHLRPSAGEVRVLGLDVHRERHRVAARTGAVMQESGFAPGLTVTETLTMWQRLYGSSTAPATLLDEVDLTHRSRVRVGALSGGEKRRLDLAAALVGDPELLFLDEPTTGLDPQSRERAWEVIRRRVRAGVTVVLTTHYLEEAEELADRLAILHAGRIVTTGTLDEVAAGQPARIRCSLPARLHGAMVPGLVGEQVWTGVGDLEIRTGDLVGDMQRLSTWAERLDARPERLRAAPPSLAEVFKEYSR